MKIAEQTVERLVRYKRLLKRLDLNGVKIVSSKEMGDMLGFKASQVRKDLSYFGEIGKRGVGYDVSRLFAHISEILSPPRKWRLGLAGLGRLGGALMEHGSFTSDRYDVVALFDVSEDKIGREFFGRTCFAVSEMAEKLKEMDIDVLVLTVPEETAQSCVDMAVASGSIKGILNFSTSSISVPCGVEVCSVDISIEMEKLLFYLKHDHGA